MEIEDSNQDSRPKSPAGEENFSPGEAGSSRGPRRPASRGGDSSRSGGDRSSGPSSGRGGERRGPASSDERRGNGDRRRSGGSSERGGRGDRPDGRRSGPKRDDEPKPAPTLVAKASGSGSPLEDLGGDFLASVSRSFSLTIRLLPDPLREPITLGYLLARALDTVADTPGVVPGTRLEHLRVLLDMIKYGPDPEILRPLQRDLVGKQTHDGERDLLKNLDRCLAWLEAQPLEDRWDLRRTLARIGRGQELDLLRFAEGTKAEPKPLATATELDEYTYFVAGCVGELWTRLCQRHLPAGWSKRDETEMLALGKRFGQGLQMVNILRDLPEDLSNGRCYLPADLLAQHGIEVADLAVSPAKARPLLNDLRQTALAHLDAAWEYVQALTPRKLRYACALPVLIGLETLGLLAKTSPLETEERLKVSRGSIKSLMASASFGALISPWMTRLHSKLRKPAASGK